VRVRDAVRTTQLIGSMRTASLTRTLSRTNHPEA